MASNINMVLQLLITARDLASAPLRGIVATIKFLDSELSVVAGKIRGAASGLFGGWIDGAIDFEAQLSRVAAKSGATAEEMQRLKQAAMQSGSSALASAQALEILTGAGLSVDDAISALAPTLRIMSTEQVNADVAARALTNTASIMGLQLSDTARIGDKLSAGASATSTSVTMLGEAFKTGGASAVSAGLSFEETVTLFTAFAKAGLEGSEAGTALTAMLTDLGKASGPARTELAKIGITSGDVGAMVDGLAKAGARGRVAIQSFSDEAGPALNAVLQLGTDGLAKYRAAIDGATGGLKTAADTIEDNTLGALRQLQVAWDAIKLTLSGPVLAPLANVARDVAQAINGALIAGALKPAEAAIKSFVDNAVQAARDFIAGFDFNAAMQSLQTFATGARDAFAGIKDAGTTAASVVQIAWNSVTAGFKTIGASLLAVGASAVSNLAAIEEAASKVGLGSLQRANELKASANDLAAKASELTQAIAQDGEDIRGAFDRLTTSTDGAASAQDRLKDALPTAELQAINLTLADYQGMAAKAAAAAEQAKTGYEAGRISAAQYGQALLDAGEANQALKDATDAQAITTRTSADAADVAAGKTAQLEKELSRARQASDGWSSGMRLNVVTLNGLRDTADATNEKLAALQERQRAGEKLDNEVAAAKQEANEAQDRYNKALDENIVQQERAIATTQKANALNGESADLALQQVQAEAALAHARGDVEAATRAENEATDLKIANLQQLAAGKQEEIAAYDALIEATSRKLAANGTLDESDKNQLATMAQTRQGMVLEQQALEQTADQTRALAEAKREQAKAAAEAAEAAKKAADAQKEHAQQTKAAGDLVGGILSGWQQRLGALSDATREAFNAQMKLGDSSIFAAKQLESFEGRMKNIEELERIAFRNRDFGLVKWLNETALKALALEKAFIAEAQAADRLTESLNSGGAGLQQMIQHAESAVSQFEFLDDQRLDDLKQAIDDANDKLREMQEAAQSAQDRIAELNAEIAAERGDADTADRLKLQLEEQKAIAEVTAELERAKNENNRELIALYQEQLDKLKTLYDLKQKNLEADIKTRDTETRTASTTPRIAAAPSQSAGGTYTLNLTSEGQSLSATTTSDPAAFLEALERAARRAV